MARIRMTKRPDETLAEFLDRVQAACRRPDDAAMDLLARMLPPFPNRGATVKDAA